MNKVVFSGVPALSIERKQCSGTVSEELEELRVHHPPQGKGTQENLSLQVKIEKAVQIGGKSLA